MWAGWLADFVFVVVDHRSGDVVPRTGRLVGLVEDMVIRAHNDLWAAVREELRSKLGERCFQRWVDPLRLLSEEGEEVRLGVANGVVGFWVERKYLPEILESLRAKAHGDVTVRIILAPAETKKQEKIEPKEIAPSVEGGGARSSEAGGEPKTATAVPGPDIPVLGDSAKRGDEKPRVAAAEPLEQSLESFVVGRSNELAYNAALKVLGSPGGAYNPLFVHGPSGVGKTHLLKGLLHAFRSQAGFWPGAGARPGETRGSGLRACYVTGEQFFQQYSTSIQDGTARKFRERYRSLHVLIVDDVQLLVSKRKTQIEFLHTFSSLLESGRQIVLASDVPPKALKDLDAGLVGRFLSGLVVGIGKPEFATRLGILRVHSRRLLSRLDDTILEFVAEQVRGSVRELIGVLMRLDIQAQLSGGTLSFAQAKEVVAEMGSLDSRRIDLRRIRDAVAAHFGIVPEIVASSNRQRHVTLARQIAMYLARRCTDESLAAIGTYFGRRDHATVKCAVEKIARLTEENDAGVAPHVRAILDGLEG